MDSVTVTPDMTLEDCYKYGGLQLGYIFIVDPSKTNADVIEYMKSLVRWVDE